MRRNPCNFSYTRQLSGHMLTRATGHSLIDVKRRCEWLQSKPF